eukprot:TRINITY_DN1084_c0_g1_i1.p1 TRINITY_DN1084_c0_g1~~TRINITY_DN1084_c0_g1_i1.p1  ORF type:complete len:409 (+),score=83.22 TRINITY_DN1084_c0_g1_i1:110-1228(+)
MALSAARMGMSVLVLMTAIVMGACGWFQNTPSMLWYRFSTSAKAVYALYTLPREHVDKFLDSYRLFEKETVTAEEDAQLIVNYYQVVNHLCAVGDVEKMYIPPVMDLKQGIFANQMIWEEKGMADKLSVRPGMKVLDVGCGRGRIAYHVATYTGAHVTGLNIDEGQIDMAKGFAESAKLLGKQLDFVQGNYNERLPFADNTFDALYHVQALTYAKDLRALLREMYRVVKPGAKISFLDWFKLPNYDGNNATHQKLLREVKAVIGAVWTPGPEDYHAALKDAGFTVLFSGEASVDGDQQWPLVQAADDFYQTFKSLIEFATAYHIIPAHFKTLIDRLVWGGQAFVDADKLRLFTTSWQIIAQKPGEESSTIQE